MRKKTFIKSLLVIAGVGILTAGMYFGDITSKATSSS